MKNGLYFKIAPLFVVALFLSVTQGFGVNPGEMITGIECEVSEKVIESYTIDKGAITVSAAENDVTYIVYEIDEETGKWVKTESGNLSARKKESFRTCTPTGEKIKLELHLDCAKCVDVELDAQFNCR